MRLMCLGDLALVGGYTENMPWRPPEGFAAGSDALIMVNWEFPIGKAVNPKPRTSGKRFIAPPGAERLIKAWSPSIATLANNHILDAGEEGLAGTIEALSKVGIRTVGAGMTAETAAAPLIWETTQGKLAIINWVLQETDPDWMVIPGPNCWPGPVEAGRQIAAVRRQADWVLVVVHWSDELFPHPMPQDRATAKQLVEMGADVVIGHHPHVVRGMERIDGHPVFYSLGNFHFAEQRNDRGEWILKEAPRNREGLGVSIDFQRGKDPACELFSFWNTGTETVLDPGGRALRRLNSLSTVLGGHHNGDYANWYSTERARFDRWGGRWHFGVRRRGLIASLRVLARKLEQRLVWKTSEARGLRRL